MIAAALADGGVCPLTNDRVLSAETVKDCLSLIYSSSMYGFSGEYAFIGGIPAKSGVSEGPMLVVPGICRIAVRKPRLDACGNPVRGVQFSRSLVGAYAFHSYASMIDDPDLVDPRTTSNRRRSELSSQLCAAAAAGDLSELRRLIAAGADVSQADYDGRTPLHLAASEGEEEALCLLLHSGADPAPTDRWGNTPLDDARREGMDAIVATLSGRLGAAAIASAEDRRQA